MTRETIEVYLKAYLGVEKILWLKKGLCYDETDGHVDNLACFVKPGVVLMQVCEDPKDSNFQRSQENLAYLKSQKDARGRNLEVIAMPHPPKRCYKESILTLSYMNFYSINHAILVPIFGGDAKETDKKALALLENLFPQKEIIALDGMKLIKEGGNIHCITQQIPYKQGESHEKN